MATAASSPHSGARSLTTDRRSASSAPTSLNVNLAVEMSHASKQIHVVFLRGDQPTSMPRTEPVGRTPTEFKRVSSGMINAGLSGKVFARPVGS